MFASSSRPGTIRGWVPSNDSYDLHYTTLATTTSFPDPPPPYSVYPPGLESTPRSAIRAPIPRSLSLDSAARPRSISDASDTSTLYTPYNNPTSTRRYKAKRQLDPNWAPRPPNAFILFRRDYVERHKGENTLADTKEPKEKTLSKRAGEAWKELDAVGKGPWFEKAKVEAQKHAEANPNYVYRPKKRCSEPRKHPALLSRREQVEEFVRKSTRRRAITARVRRARTPHYDYPAPESAGSSSSPEPPGTPSSEESDPLSSEVPTGLQHRSDSLPARLEHPMPIPAVPSHPFMSPAAILSMPSLASDRPFAPKRSLSHSDMPPYAGWEYVNFGDDYSESDEQSVFSFDSVASDLQPSVYFEGSSGHPSPAGCEITLQNPEGQFIPEPQLCSEPQYMPQPELMPTIDPATTILPSTSVAYPPTPSPLFERRRRAATISTLPSPLTVVTSSLSGWARDDLVTARMAPRTMPSPPAPVPTLQLMTDADDWTRNVPPNFDGATFASPIPDPDMDRTPRVLSFPENVQNITLELPEPQTFLDPPITLFPVPEPSPPDDMLPVPTLDPFDLTADLESYAMGLRQHGIGSGGPEAAEYGLPPFEIDYRSMFPCDTTREQA
ncbi:hypothetical protein C8Q79DRAFT_1008729 [Trametes meyenii]|nr:hypothetical protein C8Q79DRAFT_1008729 [Trametes meyenii]